MHESLKREEEILGSSDRVFGFVFVVFLSVLAAIKLAIGQYQWATGWGGGAGVLLVIALTRPGVLAPFNRLWTRFGLLLHRVMNPLIMGIMFFLVLTPFGLTMRLFGWDALRRKRRPDQATYWITRDSIGPPPETMRNQF